MATSGHESQPDQMGPYRILRTLGRGGMGVVYLGVNVETEEVAAVKVLGAAWTADKGLRTRFEGEIETLRKLNHPHIARLIGYGEQENRLFFSMEFVDGRSLEQELLAGRHFDWGEVADIGISVCTALKHAHDRGIVHRDIKPANLLLATDGTVKLSDFGIAKLFGQTRLTAAGNVLGTADFMAPEQADARPIGPRADLYSLGCVLYTLLAGRPPLVAESFVEMLRKQRTEIPAPVRRYAPKVPAEFEITLQELLAKEPSKRIRNATILARRLASMVYGMATQQAPLDSSDTSIKLTEEDREFAFAQTAGNTPKPAAGKKTPSEILNASPNPADPTRVAEPAELGSSTMATEIFTGECYPPPADSEATPPSTHDSGRFTAVDKTELGRFEEPAETPPWVSPQTWALVGAIVFVGLAAWYLLRPPSADKLYQRIMSATADKTIESYRAAEPKIIDFFEHYPDDPRRGTLREMEIAIDLSKRERRLELQTAGRGDLERLLPIERAYVEALNYMRVDPEIGMTKLQAVITLYDTRTDSSAPFDTSGPTGECLELARRRLEQMSKSIERSTADDLHMIEVQLDRADQIEPQDPHRAQAIRQAAIDLWGAKPWASPAIQRARAALDKPEPTKEKSN